MTAANFSGKRLPLHYCLKIQVETERSEPPAARAVYRRQLKLNQRRSQPNDRTG